MPPIPVHIEDPISPTQARTAEPQPQTRLEPSTNVPASNHATTTTATPTFPQTSSTPARPGAVAGPGPTTAAPRTQYTPTKTQPQPEQGTLSDVPPPPRPGDVPSLGNAAAFQTNTSTVPPPPKAGSTAQPVTIAPPQAQYSPPEQNLAPTHTTSTTTTTARPGPTTLNMGPVITPSAQHPPGYVQDAYAQELNPAQRASLEVQQERERGVASFPAGLLGGAGGGAGAGGGNAGSGEGVGEAWEAVKTWSGDTGRRMSQLAADTHDAAWNWIKKA